MDTLYSTGKPSGIFAVYHCAQQRWPDRKECVDSIGYSTWADIQCP